MHVGGKDQFEEWQQKHQKNGPSLPISHSFGEEEITSVDYVHNRSVAKMPRQLYREYHPDKDA